MKANNGSTITAWNNRLPFKNWVICSLVGIEIQISVESLIDQKGKIRL